jgi:hypothetical protein
VGASVLLPAGGVAFGVPDSGPARVSDGNLGQDLAACIAKNRKLSVLFLVDESKSLVPNPSRRDNKEGNDPFGLRVLPIKAIANVFASLADNELTQIEVNASMYGFGEGFVTRQPWINLNKDSLDQFSRVIEEQGKLNGDSYTRYHVALKGALEAFDSDPNGIESCRMIYWFSDGEHDNDDDTGLSDTEIAQIKSQVCSPGGLADQIRSNGIQLWAQGLNKDQNQTELMRLIAKNEGEFRSGKFVVGTGSCGVEPALGTYSFALDTTQIDDVIETIPGIPDQDVELDDCGSSTDDCREIAFRADKSLTSFKVRVRLSASGSQNEASRVQVVPPSGTPFDVFADANDLPDGIRVTKTSEIGAILWVQRPIGKTLEGPWSIRFLGEGAEDARGRVTFEAQATVQLTDDEGNKVEVIDRFKPKALRISVVDGKEFVEDLKVQLSDANGSKDLRPSTNTKAEFSINPKDLEALLQKPPLADALAAKLSIQPSGFIPGLFGLDNEPIPVIFAKVTTGFGITNGAAYPAYLPGAELVETQIKDTEVATIRLKFRGPDATEGIVRVLGIDDGNVGKDFELGGSTECKIPAQTEVECVFTIAPSENGYGGYSIPVRLSLDSSEAEKAQEQVVTVDVFLTRSPNVGKGVTSALLLILLFLIVQTVVRAISAVSLSRFSALDSTARRVKLSIKLSADGSISGPSGGSLAAPESGSMENNFAIEALEKQNSFDLFGYSFRSSALRTFFRSTVRECLGYVSGGGLYVFGTAGTQVVKGGPTEGRVDLSLRRQWVIGVAPDQLFALANGDFSVDADLIAIFDPYEVVPLEQQLADLQFAIGASQFGADLGIVLDRIRQEQDVAEEPPTPDNDPFASSSIGSSSPSALFDPFAPSSFSVADTEEAPSKRERRGRKARGESTNAGADSSSGGVAGDPFADPFGDPFA